MSKSTKIECDRCGVTVVEGERYGTVRATWLREPPHPTLLVVEAQPPDLCETCFLGAKAAIAAFMQGAQAQPVAVDRVPGAVAFPDCLYAGGPLDDTHRACRGIPGYTNFVQVATCHVCPHRKATEAPPAPVCGTINTHDQEYVAPRSGCCRHYDPNGICANPDMKPGPVTQDDCDNCWRWEGLDDSQPVDVPVTGPAQNPVYPYAKCDCVHRDIYNICCYPDLDHRATSPDYCNICVHRQAP